MGLIHTLVNPNVAKMCRGKTRQGAPDVASHSLRKVEAYLTVREILPETTKGADGVAWREFGGFGRNRFATLGLTLCKSVKAENLLVVKSEDCVKVVSFMGRIC